MSYQWELFDEATEAIERQMIWYESDERHGGVELADRWIGKLEPALDKMATSPRSHGMAPENGRWHPTLEIRQMLFRPWKTGIGWRVLYTIGESKKVVTVLHILHERRRWMHEAAEDESQSI
jgi:plasmid stabilization system protein ParE